MSGPSPGGDRLRKTPLHALHERLGARLVPFAGWEMPVQYSGIQQEHRAVRERAGLFDVSHMGQIHLNGPGATRAVSELVTCEVASLRVHRARYGLMLNHSGGCIDDVMVTRLGPAGGPEDSLFLCVNASNIEKDEAWIREQLQPAISAGQVVVDNQSDETALLALQGPAAASILGRLVRDPEALPKRFRVTPLEVAGHAVLVSATGYTGSPGFELYLAAANAPALFEELLDEGQAEGLLPVGLGARDTLRLEAALPLYGHELDDTTTPVEAGLDRFVRTDDAGFIGADALARPEAHPRRLVGLELRGRGIARADHAIVHQGTVVGRVTSGAPSPTLGKSIALGYVPRELSEIGQRISVRIRKNDVEADVVKLPFLPR